MNTVAIMGRLTKDPTVRYTAEKQMCIASLNIAVPDGKDKSNFINCKAFGKVAEIIEKYAHKGDLVGIEGKIQTGSYEKDGKKTYTFEVIINNLTLTPKESKTEEVKEDVQCEIPTGFASVDDDDIPF